MSDVRFLLRDAEMVAMRLEGKTYKQIAEAHGVTEMRVRQIIGRDGRRAPGSGGRASGGAKRATRFCPDVAVIRPQPQPSRPRASEQDRR